MREFGWQGSQITVEGHYRVTEGQHRVEAAIKTGTPVQYIISKDPVTLDMIQKMNVAQSKWKDIDFVRSRADSGDINCKNYMQLYTEFVVDKKAVPNATILEVVTRTYKSSTMQIIKSGNFTLTLEDYAKAREEVQFIGECYAILKKCNKKLGRNDYFGRAILFMLDSGASKERITKIIEKNALSYVSASTVDLALKQLEGFYNKGLRADQRIQFVAAYELYQQNRKLKSAK